MRIAWFSPMPPVRSGIAACSADVVPALREQHLVDVFAGKPAAAHVEGLSTHEFVWRHRLTPYDLTIYQVGNSAHHDFLWPYLFRFPGLAVLHDPHLHHARAAALLRAREPESYRAEFHANHPEATPDAAELAVAGFDSNLYYLWPMTRLVVERSKLTAVHSRPMVTQLRADLATEDIEYLRLSQGTLLSDADVQSARSCVRRRYGIDSHAVVFGCFGGLTPDKRLPQILDAFAAILNQSPEARLMLGGACAAYYDVTADVRSRGLEDRVVLTGYLETDADLTEAIAAVDVTLNLRWPTSREISGPWLRSMAAGKPSIVIELLQIVDVPTLDPRTWMPNCGRCSDEEPIAVGIDILDEDHSLRLAMRRLAADAELRRTLGESSKRHWLREHSPAAMLQDYERLIVLAKDKASPRVALPRHLRDDGTRLLETLLQPFGLPAPIG